MTTVGRPTFDLLDPAFYRDDPQDAYRWMRQNEPVYRDDTNGLWVVARHADVRDVELRADVFVSGQGYRANHYPDERNMIALDDPRHRQQRRLVAGRFTPQGVAALEEEIGAIIGRLLDALAEAEEVEVVDALAAQLPGRMVCHLLGMPEEEWPLIKSWSERLMRTDMAFRDQQALQDFGGASWEIAERVTGDLLPARRRDPGDDLISVWATAEIDGAPLDEDTIVHETGLFVAGGAETTRTVIAHGLRAFCDHPDAWEHLATDPAVLQTAVEEVIRWVTPLNNFFRTAVEKTAIGDQPVAAGDRIMLLYPSANRDEAVFNEPDRFVISRHPNPHLSFGFGPHFCVGNHLARLELRILFGEMARRFTDLRAVTEPEVEPNIFARAVRSFRLAYRVR